VNDCIVITIKFDSPFKNDEAAQRAAEVFAEQLTDVLVTPPNGPWGWLRARVVEVKATRKRSA
jgi:hypothetical protein